MWIAPTIDRSRPYAVRVIGEWMRPGGRLGLQNRMRPDIVGLGGFDSHALPPRLARLATRLLIGLLLCRPVATHAQGGDFESKAGLRHDSTAHSVRADSGSQLRRNQIPPDSVRPPVTPGHAFFRSALLPGWGQSNLGSHRTAVGMLVVEAISIAMIRESGADDREARRTENDTIIDSYVGPDGTTLVTPSSHAGQFGTPEVLARRSHVEDWAALLVANHLFSGADAFVEASLWDVKAHLTLRTALTSGGAVVAAAFHW